MHSRVHLPSMHRANSFELGLKSTKFLKRVFALSINVFFPKFSFTKFKFVEIAISQDNEPSPGSTEQSAETPVDIVREIEAEERREREARRRARDPPIVFKDALNVRYQVVLTFMFYLKANEDELF